MNVIIPCLGQLNVPKVPQFDGRDRYQGEAFHSADWRKDYDATGRTVAVIGTGASAVQIVPTLAPKVCMEFYCPQTKFEKVMFLHLSVSHSVHRGGGLPQCMLGYHHPPRPGTPPPRSRDGYCCGRYASYWNALLLQFFCRYCIGCSPILRSRIVTL